VGPELMLVGEAPNAQGQVFWQATYFRGRVPRLPGTNLLKRFPGAQSKGAAFPLAEAREAVRRLERRTPKRVSMVLLGKRVGAAFGAKGGYFEWTTVRGRRVMVFPHPSGINQWWNDPENRALAAEVSQELAE
jgi:uracil-DNA glycosylase